MRSKVVLAVVVLCMLPVLLQGADYRKPRKSTRTGNSTSLMEEKEREKVAKEKLLKDKWKKVPPGETPDAPFKVASEFCAAVYRGDFSSAKEKSTDRARKEVEKLQQLKKKDFQEYREQKRYFNEIKIDRTAYWPNPKRPHYAFLEANLMIRNEMRKFYVLMEKVKGKWLVSDIQKRRMIVL